MRKPLYICLPYRESDRKVHFPYVGQVRPFSVGDILRIEFDSKGRPIVSTCTLVDEEI